MGGGLEKQQMTAIKKNIQNTSTPLNPSRPPLPPSYALSAHPPLGYLCPLDRRHCEGGWRAVHIRTKAPQIDVCTVAGMVGVGMGAEPGQGCRFGAAVEPGHLVGVRAARRGSEMETVRKMGREAKVQRRKAEDGMGEVMLMMGEVLVESEAELGAMNGGPSRRVHGRRGHCPPHWHVLGLHLQYQRHPQWHHRRRRHYPPRPPQSCMSPSRGDT